MGSEKQKQPLARRDDLRASGNGSARVSDDARAKAVTEAPPTTEAPDVDTGRESVSSNGTVAIEIPISREIQTGYLNRRVDVKLTRTQAQTLRAIVDAIPDEELRSGHIVKNNGSRAVQWLLERITKEMES